jgi:transposase-like protein
MLRVDRGDDRSSWGILRGRFGLPNPTEDAKFLGGGDPMRMGRPPVGLAHVDRIEGPADLKERLRVVLATITSEMTVEQACEQLGVGPSRLHEMRRQALDGALAGLAPGRPGRPPGGRATTSEREHALEQRVRELEADLHGALVRSELALAVPHLFRRAAKKNSRISRMKRPNTR